MSLNLREELRRHFEFDSFRPCQLEAIHHILNKQNTLVVMLTGAGKSLCYQLPALLDSGTSLVVSPLIALMKDQVEALQSSGKSATFINSSLTTVEQNQRMRDMRQGRFCLVYVAPERFRSNTFLSALTDVPVSLFVVEEVLSLEHEEIGIVTQAEDSYPKNLKKAFDAPPILFVRGAILPKDEKAVSIVGSRDASLPAQELTKELAKGFVEMGWTVVSGLAKGIDTAAHQGALQRGRRALGVLGSGVRIIHPKENMPIAEKMIQQGAVLSELHPNTPPYARNLMARDRIISGLSKAVIVVEAGEKSGSVDTAKKAWKQKRLVFAVNSSSPGTSWLIQKGAQPILPESLNFEEVIQIINEHQKGTLMEQIEIFTKN